MKGFLIITLFLLLGEFVAGLLAWPVPGAIFGMLFLLTFLSLSRGGHETLHQIADRLLPLLPLFIIPTSVGIVSHWQLIRQHALVLSVSVIFSFLLLFVFTVMTLRISKRLHR